MCGVCTDETVFAFVSVTVCPAVVSSRETMERLGWRVRLTGAKPETLELMTGIKERRFFEKGTTGVQVRFGTACSTQQQQSFYGGVGTPTEGWGGNPY